MLKKFARMSRRRLLIVGIIAAYLIGGVSGGCFAHQRPERLSSQEESILHDPPLPYSATVVWWDEKTKTGQNPEAYAGPLAKILSRSGAFRTNQYQRAAIPGKQDLIATSTGVYCNTAALPFLTILTLGVVPTIFRDEQCQGMLLRKSSDDLPRKGITIEVRERPLLVMGWVAVPMGLLPGWSYGEVKDDERFAQRFRLAVLERANEIHALVSDSTRH
jgi:hypothetical protein